MPDAKSTLLRDPATNELYYPITSLQAVQAEGEEGQIVGLVKTNKLGVFSIYDTVAPNAGAHNSIFRGKYLGDHATEEQYAAIQAGTFDDLFIGDYWTINDINWRIGAFNYFFNAGQPNCTTHHAVIVPDTGLYSYPMNDDNTTNGGYYGSKMRKEGLTQANTMVEAAFSSNHILKHYEYLVNTVTNGKPSGAAWYESYIELMNEIMVYGSIIFSPVSDGTTIPRVNTVAKTQFPLFTFLPNMISNRVSFWLRDVISNTNFALVGGDGAATNLQTSINYGVRPYFCIY